MQILALAKARGFCFLSNRFRSHPSGVQQPTQKIIRVKHGPFDWHLASSIAAAEPVKGAFFEGTSENKAQIKVEKLRFFDIIKLVFLIKF